MIRPDAAPRSGPSVGSPAVSIGVTTFNRRPLVEEAISSLIGQSWHDFELILCDDGSTDGTRQACEAWAARDHRIRYEPNPSRLGAIANMNRVLELARGPYFLLADSDDLWGRDYLQRLLASLEAAPQAVLAYGDVDLIDAEGNQVRRHEGLDALATGTRFAQALAFARALEEDGKANIIHGLVRTHALRAIGGYRSHGPREWGFDYQTLLALLGHGPFVFAAGARFHKRIHASVRPSFIDAWTNLLGVRSYLKGLDRVASELPGLDDEQRRTLRKAIARKRADLYTRRIARRLLRPLSGPA